MKRKKIENCRNDEGFIDLNKLNGFQEKGIVVEGSNAKMWFNVNGDRFLFKAYESILPCFGEVLYYRASQMCGINCAEYDFATFNGKIGTISYDFLNENEAYYNFLELSCQFGNSNFDLENISNNRDLLIIQNNKYNNMNSIRKMVEDLFVVSLEEKADIEMGLIDMFVLDTLFWHLDRTLWNYGIVVDEESDEVKLAKIHDNSYVLCLNRGKEYIEETIVSLINGGVINLPRKKCSSFDLIFEDDDSIEQLIGFYERSNEFVKERIEMILKNLNVEKVIKETSEVCKIDDVSVLWIKAILNFRKKTILRGLESVKINHDEAQLPSITFSKRK